MKKYNQYSEFFYTYEIENGKSLFDEYKLSSDERKREIEDLTFNLMRLKGEVPTVIIEDSLVDKSLVTLSESSVYDGNSYGLSNAGVDVIKSIFREMLYVSKKNRDSVYDIFMNDVKLKKAIRKCFTYSNSEIDFFSWIRLDTCGYGDTFRPASAKSLYENFGKGTDCRVFDSSAGYGARLMGAHFATNVSEYLGIDPNTKESCDKLIGLLDSRFDTNTKKTVLKMGSEDFCGEDYKMYQNYFDISFTSPPYFDTERYSNDDTQSYKKFPTYAQWIDGFYRRTIYNICDALKLDGVFSINIFEKIDKIKDITKLFLADCGWYIYKEDRYLLRQMPGGHHKFDEYGNDLSMNSNFEPIWYAKHYTQLFKEGSEEYIKAKNRVTRGNKS